MRSIKYVAFFVAIFLGVTAGAAAQKKVTKKSKPAAGMSCSMSLDKVILRCLEYDNKWKADTAKKHCGKTAGTAKQLKLTTDSKFNPKQSCPTAHLKKSTPTKAKEGTFQLKTYDAQTSKSASSSKGKAKANKSPPKAAASGLKKDISEGLELLDNVLSSAASNVVEPVEEYVAEDDDYSDDEYWDEDEDEEYYPEDDYDEAEYDYDEESDSDDYDDEE